MKEGDKLGVGPSTEIFNIRKHSHSSYLSPMKMEHTEWSETSAYKIQTLGNYPEESIQHCNKLFSFIVSFEFYFRGQNEKLFLWNIFYHMFIKGHAVAQSVEALRYKSEGRGFDSRWCHWNFSLT